MLVTKEAHPHLTMRCLACVPPVCASTLILPASYHPRRKLPMTNADLPTFSFVQGSAPICSPRGTAYPPTSIQPLPASRVFAPPPALLSRSMQREFLPILARLDLCAVGCQVSMRALSRSARASRRPLRMRA